MCATMIVTFTMTSQSRELVSSVQSKLLQPSAHLSKKFNNQTLMMIATITREVVSSVQPKVSQPSPQPPWNYGAKGGSPSPYRSKAWAYH